MKLLIAVLLLSLSSTVMAWEVEGNPDRYLSLGINVSNANLNGTRTETDFLDSGINRVFKGPSEIGVFSTGVDMRLPVTKAITFTLSCEKIEMTSQYTRNPNPYRESNNLDGYRYGFGARFFLH